MTENARRRGGFRVAGFACTLLAITAVASVALALGHDTSAVAFAAGVTLVGVGGGWLAAWRPGDTPSARVAGGLASVALRMLPALVALGWLQAAGGRLREAGAGEILLLTYLAALAVEIVRTIMEKLWRRRQPGADRTI